MIYFVHVDVAVHIVEEELVVPPVEPVMRGTVVGAPHCERATHSKTKRAKRRRRRRRRSKQAKRNETRRGWIWIQCEGGGERGPYSRACSVTEANPTRDAPTILYTMWSYTMLYVSIYFISHIFLKKCWNWLFGHYQLYLVKMYIDGNKSNIKVQHCVTANISRWH